MVVISSAKRQTGEAPGFIHGQVPKDREWIGIVGMDGLPPPFGCNTRVRKLREDGAFSPSTIVSKVFRRWSFLLWGGCFLVLLPIPRGDTAEFVWAVRGGVRFFHLSGGLSQHTQPLHFERQMTGATFLLGALGLLHFNDQLELYATLDVGEIFLGSGQPDQSSDRSFWFLLNRWQLNATPQTQSLQTALQTQCEEQVKSLQQLGRTGISVNDCKLWPWYLQENFFLRELYVSFALDPKQAWKFQIGMMRRTLGNALLYDNYSLGIRFVVDLSKHTNLSFPLQITLDAFLPDSSFTPEGKRSPVLHMAFQFTPLPPLRMEFFTTYLYDGNNLAGRLLLPLWQRLFSNEWNERIYKITGKNPQLSCEANPQQDALKALLPSDLRKEQEACEQENQAREKRGETPIACPVDERILIPYEQSCTIPDSTGHHVWFGVQASWKTKRWQLRGLGILYLSWSKIGLPTSPQLRLPTAASAVSLQSLTLSPQQSPSPETPTIADKFLRGVGFTGELEWTYHWTPRLSSTLFLLFATGDQVESPGQTTFSTFMGIAPQPRYTNIFFNGGINSVSSRRGISIAGIAGTGTLAPGAWIRYEEKDRVLGQITVASLWSHVPPSTIGGETSVGNFYGVELNLMGEWQATTWLRPVAQVDLFFPGSFFASPLRPPVVFQLQVGSNFVF